MLPLLLPMSKLLRSRTTIMTQLLFITEWPSDRHLSMCFYKFCLVCILPWFSEAGTICWQHMPHPEAPFTQSHHAINTSTDLSMKIVKTSPKITDAASIRTRFQNQEQAREMLATMKRREVLLSPSLHTCFLGYKAIMCVQNLSTESWWKDLKSKWIVAAR